MVGFCERWLRMSVRQMEETGVFFSFMSRLENALSGHSFVKLVLGKYRGQEAYLQKILVRAVEIRGKDMLTFVFRHKTCDITRNFGPEEGLRMIRDLLGHDFRSASLFTLSDVVQLEFNKRGEGVLGSSPVAAGSMPGTGHDHVKRRLIDPSRPFLQALGITNGQHQVLPSMSRKWKQINVFLDIFQHALHASRAAGLKQIRVVDYGSGKGYLTFAVADYLQGLPGVEFQVTGVEQRVDLVSLCQAAAAKSSLSGLAFILGDVKTHIPGSLHVMMALHACDTATDLAIHAGIRSGAEIIMCAPCCHKEIRPQMTLPPVLGPVLRFGVHLGQEAEMVTDALRALWLEASGYDAQVFEFISPEETHKNKMILAVKRAQPADREPILAQIKALHDFYGIQQHALATLLNGLR